MNQLINLAAGQAEVRLMSKRNQELYEKAAEERRRCCDWLLPFLRDNQPKFLTKAELRDAAIRELKVSKKSFDFAWIEAIEQTGRHDWYEPLRRRPRVKS
jgi:hypothetical protein